MRTSLLVLFGSALYATARYNVFKGVPWSDWPTYTLNKALALSALLLLAVSVVRRSALGHSTATTTSMASVFAATHVVLSLTLLTPAYYEKFYAQGKLSATAGWSMLLGAVAGAAMIAGKRTLASQDTRRELRILATLAFVIGLHAALQGFAGWFAPSEWPGMLPPITLISFLLGLGALAVAASPTPRR